jgi:dihydroanticapsin dehydrogenase
MRFQNKVVLITGGASGIGKACVRRFLDEGASVAFADVNDELASSLLAERPNQPLLYVHSDITDEAAVDALVRATLERFARIDVLVNNAAIFILKSIDATVDDWERMLRVNIMGQALVTREVVAHMQPRRSGVIVNIGSISASIAQPRQLTYNVTKAAMVEMTKCLALDLKDDGIRVNAVSPGWVMTENVRHLLYDERGWSDEQIRAEVGNLHLSGRLADPSEIAATVAFLASDDASFVNGANLMADGGYTAI